MRRSLSFIISLVLICCLTPTSFAASQESTQSADALHDLGLFSGVGNNSDGSINYDLDRAPTRAEAVTMLVRLLGKEKEALGNEWTTPFTDVAEWAKPYVGYAYENKLTNGVGSDGKGGQLFGGSMTTSATQYLTFVLRALGYDSTVDFQWDRAWELTDQLGITNGEYSGTTDFLRANIALVSESALSAKGKNTESTLLDTLVADGAVTSEAAETYRSNPVRVKSVTISDNSCSLKIGDTKKLTANVVPDNATEKDISWSTSNPSVASVSPDGLVTALSKGTAIIKAVSANGKQAICEISVSEVEVTAINLSLPNSSIKVGESTRITATITPQDANNKTIVWSSSNTSVVTVSEGTVRGIAPGSATISARSANGIIANCTIIVEAAPISYSAQGDRVIEGVNIPAGYYAEYTHDGNRHFHIKLYYGDQSYNTYLIVNTSKVITGQYPLNYHGKVGIVDGTIEVEGDGNWTLDFKPIGGITTKNIAGSGSIVSGLFTADKARYTVTTNYTGSRHIDVKVIKYGGESYNTDLVMNQSKAGSSQKVVNLDIGSRYYIAVSTVEGSWTVDLGTGDVVTTYTQPYVAPSGSNTRPSNTNTPTDTPSSNSNSSSSNKWSRQDALDLSNYVNAGSKSANTASSYALEAYKRGSEATRLANLKFGLTAANGALTNYKAALGLLNRRVELTYTGGGSLNEDVQTICDLLSSLDSLSTEAADIDASSSTLADVIQQVLVKQVAVSSATAQLLSQFN